MRIYIKYMVSLRCKMILKSELERLGLPYHDLELGMVDLVENLNPKQRKLLAKNLLIYGLELLEDQKMILIEKIKNVIIDMIHYSEEVPKVNYSDYISNKIELDYTYLSNTFSEVLGTTIQKFIINHKIEKIKELILYDEMSLSEISYKMHYSSPAHLSNQFKKVTGLTPSFFKKLKLKRIQNLEKI